MYNIGNTVVLIPHIRISCVDNQVDVFRSPPLPNTPKYPKQSYRTPLVPRLAPLAPLAAPRARIALFLNIGAFLNMSGITKNRTCEPRI